jgi:hypothetical protein
VRHPVRMASSEGPIIVDVDGSAELDNGMRIPGHGPPPRPEDLQPFLQPWARLTRNQALGKKTILDYNNVEPTAQGSMTTILDVGGRTESDLDACQICVTLSQPRVIKAPYANGGIGNFNQQNASGSYSNAEIGSGDFPGTIEPIAWVPVTAVVEWGLGGTRHTAYVDYVQGATINLTAAWVRVSAAVAQDATNAPGTSALYEIAANIGPGWPKPGIAQRTVFLGIVPAETESAVFAVPPFAKKATVVSRDDSAVAPPALTAAYLRFWQGPTGVAVGGNVGNYFQSGNQPIAFDVPNAGAYFSVQSAMAIDVEFDVIFELAI